MSVANTLVAVQSYTGDGVTTSFPLIGNVVQPGTVPPVTQVGVPLYYQSLAHVQAKQGTTQCVNRSNVSDNPMASGVVTSLTTVFTVSGGTFDTNSGTYNGGNAVFDVAPLNGVVISIYRSTFPLRSTAFSVSTPLIPSSINGDNDKTILAVADVNANYVATIKLPTGEDAGFLPAPAFRKGLSLGFDSITGLPIIVPGSAIGGVVSAIVARDNFIPNDTAVWDHVLAHDAINQAYALSLKTQIEADDTLAIASFTLPTTGSTITKKTLHARNGMIKVSQGTADDCIHFPGYGASTVGTAGQFLLPVNMTAVLRRLGVGTIPKVPPVKITNPATLPTNNISGAVWSPDGRYLALSCIGTPFIIIYDWTTGAPVKITDPATLPTGNANNIAWSPDGRYLAIAHDTTPFVTIYDWSTGSPVKISNPAALPASNGNGAAWSPDGRYLAIAHNTTPFVTIYDWITGVPVKITDPAALPASTGDGCAWSPDGKYLAVAHVTTPFVTIYDWTTGAPVKITNPATLPTGNGNKAAWSPDGRYLSVAHAVSPFVTIYDWITGLPIKITDPATLPAGTGQTPSWSLDGRYLAIAHNTTPFVTIYDWITGIPVKITDPATLTGGNAQCAAWSPDGRYLAVGHSGGSFVTIYSLLASANNIWIVEQLIEPQEFASPIGTSRKNTYLYRLRTMFK